MKFEVMFEIKKTNGLTTIKQTNFAYFWLYSITNLLFFVCDRL